MFGLLASIKHRSEAALRSAILFAVAGGLATLALGFGAGAFVAFLSTKLPFWAALLSGAGVLLIAAAVCAAAASRRPPAPPAQPAAAALFGAAASASSMKDLILRLAEHEARHNPAAAAAIAAAAGLLLGALDGEPPVDPAAHGSGGADA